MNVLSSCLDLNIGEILLKAGVWNSQQQERSWYDDCYTAGCSVTICTVRMVGEHSALSHPGCITNHSTNLVLSDMTLQRVYQRTALKPNSIALSWSQTGPRLVADLLARASLLPAS